MELLQMYKAYMYIKIRKQLTHMHVALLSALQTFRPASACGARPASVLLSPLRRRLRVWGPMCVREHAEGDCQSGLVQIHRFNVVSECTYIHE